VVRAERGADRRSPEVGDQAYNVAMLAPPWIPTPPEGYGGIEQVVDLLCEGLVGLGHQVALFAPPGSTSSAVVREVLPECHPDEMGKALYESDHVARVFDVADKMAKEGRPFDVVHDHSGFTAVAFASRISTPIVHTLHGPFTTDTSDFYRYHARHAWLVAISEAQRASAPAGVRIGGVVPNPIDVDSWPFKSKKQNYVLWAGRFDEIKGPHRAIAAAQSAKVPVVLAGPIQSGQESYFEEQIEPHLDGDQARYEGEVGGTVKQELFANALALLMPITWDEPFGMVMVEALACGTPVIAFPQGAAAEIVQHEVNGYLVDDEHAMAAAIADLHQIDPAACRESVATRFSPETVAAGYAEIYAEATNGRRGAVVAAP
jgi:glycosyltransferase involved in cell wall biosynthesis